MKRILPIVAGFLLSSAAYSQNLTTTPVVSYTIEDDLAWIQRYDKDVQAIRERDKNVTDFKCDALFVGSSSINFWSTLNEDFPGLKVLNRGYGGATIRDILFNYKTVMGKWQPDNIVFYCDNEVAGDRVHDVTVGQWYDLYRTIFEKFHRDYPQAHVYALSIKFSGVRTRLREHQRVMNFLLQEYCRDRDWISFVDVTTPLLGPDGTPDDRYYLDDKLHITREGYTLWTKEINKAGLK